MQVIKDTIASLFDTNSQSRKDSKETVSSVYDSYQQLMTEQPNLRRRDIAQALSVAEAALIDNQCGVQSIRLVPDFAEIIQALPSLGHIMTLTRNDSAVHERKGIYSNVRIRGAMGLVITDDRRIDLRIILSRWVLGFAVQESTANGARYSLQFFDKSGVAIQKIYLQADSDFRAFEQLLVKFSNLDNNSELQFVDKDKAPDYTPSVDVDAQALTKQWQEMTNVHQFMGILKEHHISREQSFEIVGEPLAQQFEPSLFAPLIEQIAQTDLSIMCFVGNHGNIQIHTGAINKVKRVGPWFNILDPEFNLHLLEDNIASAWVVKKPTVDGDVTSVELFDANGETITQIFGKREEGQPENEQWRSFTQGLLAKQVAA